MWYVYYYLVIYMNRVPGILRAFKVHVHSSHRIKSIVRLDSSVNVMFMKLEIYGGPIGKSKHLNRGCGV